MCGVHFFPKKLTTFLVVVTFKRTLNVQTSKQHGKKIWQLIGGGPLALGAPADGTTGTMDNLALLDSVSIINVPHHSKPQQATIIYHQPDWFQSQQLSKVCIFRLSLNVNPKLIISAGSDSEPSSAASHCCVSKNTCTYLTMHCIPTLYQQKVPKNSLPLLQRKHR